ncbi:MAG TPA: hypothetical protein PKL34_01630 [Candidatus Cloacimonadota bacterium]|nr:hypothetical protein [Candidatus Cloacimonadota bacterium]
MKKSWLAILIAISVGLLGAQMDPLHHLRFQVAQNPTNANARMNLAYQLMLSGEYNEALSHYEALLLQGAKHEAAMTGVLWALQSLGKYRESSLKADKFLSSSSDPSPILSYKAYALSATGRHLSARSYYSKAGKLAKNESTAQKSSLGLAWEYLWLSDAPRARVQLNKLTTEAAVEPKEWLDKASNMITLKAGTDYDDLISTGLSYQLHKAAWGFGAEYEELFVDSERFRQMISARAKWQSPIIDLTAAVKSLSGNDDRVYPGVHYSLALQSPYFLGKVRIVPSLRGHFASYQRFDTQQADLAMRMDSDDLSASYSYSLLYHDDDSIGSDHDEQIHSFSLGVRVFKQSWLTAYLHLGDQAWWTSPYMVVYDDFEADNTVYGLSLSTPIYQKFNLLLYSQLGDNDDEAVFSSSLSLAYSY